MSYCLAWKKEKNIFMIADSAISSESGEVYAEKNTFGELQGLYGQFVVTERRLKIYKLTEDIVISFAGTVELADEIIKYIYDFYTEISFLEILKTIENTYKGCEIQLIIAKSFSQDRKYLYYFNKDRFVEVDKIEIGYGKTIVNFSTDVNAIIDHFYINGMDRNDYIAKILAVIQCYSYRINTFANGVGGVFTGVIFDTKIRWFRDIEYYFFNEDIRLGKTLSVIACRNSIFTSTDFDGSTRCFVNGLIDGKFFDDEYNISGIVKSLNTKNAYYYIFYNSKYNVIGFLRVNGQTQNIHFRRWIRRNKENTYYAYAFDPEFAEQFENVDSSNERLPSLIEFPVIKDRYMSHDEVFQLINESDIDRVGIQEMDFDFNENEYMDYDISKIQDIKKSIEEYHNLIIIDFSYFCDALEEKINLYSPYRQCSVSQMKLDAIVDTFLKQMVPDEFSKFRLVIIKNRDDNRIITGIDMKSYLSQFSNCIIIESENILDDFCGTLFQLMKNYYLNDTFFHLDKFIIIADNKDVNDLLLLISPKFNFNEENPDIILVRNLNGFTSMYGTFRYIVIDYLIVAMLGISIEEYGQLESLVYDMQDN